MRCGGGAAREPGARAGTAQPDKRHGGAHLLRLVQLRGARRRALPAVAGQRGALRRLLRLRQAHGEAASGGPRGDTSAPRAAAAADRGHAKAAPRHTHSLFSSVFSCISRFSRLCSSCEPPHWVRRAAATRRCAALRRRIAPPISAHGFAAPPGSRTGLHRPCRPPWAVAAAPLRALGCAAPGRRWRAALAPALARRAPVGRPRRTAPAVRRHRRPSREQPSAVKPGGRHRPREGLQRREKRRAALRAPPAASAASPRAARRSSGRGTAERRRFAQPDDVACIRRAPSAAHRDVRRARGGRPVLPAARSAGVASPSAAASLAATPHSPRRAPQLRRTQPWAKRRSSASG